MSGTLAIVNPAAGRDAAVRAWRQVRSAVSAAGDWECAMTEAPGHARALASQAAANGLERVIAVGGDGTASEVANGLAHSPTALAIIPAGTGNDLARNLRIPRDPVAAARLALSSAPRALDLGEFQNGRGTRYFVNLAGFGFDSEVAWRVNQMPKVLNGTVPYLAGVLATLRHYRAPMMSIRLDDRAVRQRMFLVAVGNCASYGGGMRIAPDARPDDGLFDVCLVSDLSRVAVLRLLPRLYSGTHTRHPAVEIVRCRSVSADADARVLCQADGELSGELSARFAVRAGALQCVVGPAAPT